MTAMVRGWCPSLARPMPTGDGLLARLSPPGGAMTADQARALAAAALRHGSGVLQVTSRAAIQVRGLTAASAECFASEITEAGFLDASRVVRPPLIGDDPAVASEVDALCTAIERALFEWSPLPKKFGVAVDAGGVLPTGEAGCDVVVRYGAGSWSVARGRRTERSAAPIGWHAYEVDERGAFVIALPFGMAKAVDFARLASRMDGGTIRPTPWRAFALTGRNARAIGESSGGFIADPLDPRLKVFACPGAPSCGTAQVATLEHASQIALLRLPYAVHVSGCTKGCAHPGAVPITLVGIDGCYALVRNGRASDPPSSRGLNMLQPIAAVAA